MTDPTRATAATGHAQEQVPVALTLIRGGKDEAECSCGEPDVYDGYAACEVHPDGT